MKPDTYKYHMLAVQIDDKIIEIDWSKVNLFENFKDTKYKLEKIDFFTSHYRKPEQLLSTLVENGILTLKQLKKAKLIIMPFKWDERNKKIKIFADNQLNGGLIYKASQKYLLEDYQLIHLLYDLLNDFEFIQKLYDFYVTNGKYNQRSICLLGNQIKQIEEKIQSGNTDLNGYRIGLLKEFSQLNESFVLLNRIYSYSQSLNDNDHISFSQTNLAQVYIEEFFMREKYYVIGCKQGNYERRILTYKLKSKERCVNYLQFHNLLTFIQNYLQEKELRETPEPISYEKQKKLDYVIPGQLSFF